MKKFALLFAVVLLPAACVSNNAPLNGVPVVAVSATSAQAGHPAGNALDGVSGTYWSPDGDPANEGLTVTLAQPVRPDVLRIITPDAGRSFSLYLDGAFYSMVESGREIVLTSVGSVQTLFIRCDDSQPVKINEIELREHFSDAIRPVIAQLSLPGKVEASSQLEPAPAYDPGQLFDGRLDFGWAEGVPGNGEGESLRFTFEKPAALDGMYVANGYQRSDDHFRKNGRVKKAEIYADGKLIQTVTLADSTGYQFVKFDKAVTAMEVTFKIVSVYPGSKYEDTVISELAFSDRNRVINFVTDYFQRMKVFYETKVKQTILEDMIGSNLVMSVADEYNVNTVNIQMKLRSNGSFVVWYSRLTEYEPTGTSKETSFVLDGNWQVVEASSLKAVVSIFGKKNILEKIEYWEDPYNEGERRQTVSIFSDKLTIEKFSSESLLIIEKDTSPASGDSDLRIASEAYRYPNDGSPDPQWIIDGTSFGGIFPYGN